MKEVHARAVVSVTLSIPVRSSWGADCTLGQVHQQAVEDALAAIRSGLPTFEEGLQIVGDPQVRCITTEE